MAAGDVPICDEEVSWARAQMRAGQSLADIAEDIGCTAGALDIALWDRLGQQAEAA